MGNLFARSKPEWPIFQLNKNKNDDFRWSISIDNMTEQDVCQWLINIDFGSLSEDARLLGINGLHLKQKPISRRIQSLINNLPPEEKERFLLEIKRLKAPKPLKPLPVIAQSNAKEEAFILEKLSNRYRKSLIEKTNSSLTKEAEVLSNPEKMKETLLKLDNSEIQKINNRGWRIKVVITELSHNPLPKNQQNFRSQVSTLLNIISLAPTFGMFHSAIIVGPFYLHWNDSELIIPRSENFMSSAAYFACDITTVETTAEDGFERIARLVCSWNRTKKYHNLQSNCHHFVEEMFSVLGVDLNEFIKNSAIGDYLSRLKSSGSCDLRYKMSDDLLVLMGDWLKEQGYNQDEKFVIFETHKQLDNFYRKIDEVDSKYFLSSKGQQDRALLKSFDRGFWLRYFHLESRMGDESKNSVEKSKYEDHSCPFGNPRGESFR